MISQKLVALLGACLNVSQDLSQVKIEHYKLLPLCDAISKGQTLSYVSRTQVCFINLQVPRAMFGGPNPFRFFWRVKVGNSNSKSGYEASNVTSGRVGQVMTKPRDARSP